MTSAFQGDAFPYDAFQILGIVAESNITVPEGQICAQNFINSLLAMSSAEMLAASLLEDIAARSSAEVMAQSTLTAIVASHVTRCCARECAT